MTLIQLEYIIAVHTLQHFGRAAERCYITQPSLSLTGPEPFSKEYASLF
ncbi:MAG TPA: LysR family transcriptional regulator [Saprospiraceae bacterium]|nr:LysR family transcriptional regulator [Saprospiraceae bacterium]